MRLQIPCTHRALRRFFIAALTASRAPSAQAPRQPVPSQSRVSPPSPPRRTPITGNFGIYSQAIFRAWA